MSLNVGQSTCRKFAANTGNSLATAKIAKPPAGVMRIEIKQTPPAVPESAVTLIGPTATVHAAPPSVAANTSSWRGAGVAPCNPARAWKSAAIAGAADSATANALPNSVVLIIALLLINAEFMHGGTPHRGPLTSPPFGLF